MDKSAKEVMAQAIMYLDNARLQDMRNDLERSMAQARRDKDKAYYDDAIGVVNDEAKRRRDFVTVPPAVLSMIATLDDAHLIATREHVSTMPMMSEPSRLRIGNFIKAINKELDRRSMNKASDKAFEDNKPDAMEGVPEDLRKFFATPGPEVAYAPRPGAEADEHVGIAFTKKQLEYLDRAVNNYHDPEPNDKDTSDEILSTVEVALKLFQGLT